MNCFFIAEHIFLPGILLVFFIIPLWHQSRSLPGVKPFLKGVGITAAGLIAMTAISQTFSLEVDLINYLVLGISALLLLSKKIPAPLIIILVAILGLIL